MAFVVRSHVLVKDNNIMCNQSVQSCNIKRFFQASELASKGNIITQSETGDEGIPNDQVAVIEVENKCTEKLRKTMALISQIEPTCQGL